MQIVREITSKRAVYLLPDFELIEITQDGMTAPSVRALDIRSGTHEVVEGDAPILWVGGALAFDGVWSVVNQEQYDEAALRVSTAEALRAAEASKLTGIEILGVMCSATKTDQSGLTAVALGVTLARMAATTFPDTKFEFENGNSLVVTNTNFDAIYAAWTPFRQSFFTP